MGQPSNVVRYRKIEVFLGTLHRVFLFWGGKPVGFPNRFISAGFKGLLMANLAGRIWMYLLGRVTELILEVSFLRVKVDGKRNRMC